MTELTDPEKAGLDGIRPSGASGRNRYGSPFESALYFSGPGAMNCVATRGFPTAGDTAFPGEHTINQQLATFMKEGGKVYRRRLGLSLHGLRVDGLREEDLVEGVIPTHPLDVRDAVIHYTRKGAVINSTSPG